MIFLFPNLETLHLVLTSGTLESPLVLAPTTVSFDADGRPYVEAARPLSKAATDALKRLGVKGAKRHAGPAVTVANWLQILPVVREPRLPDFSSQTPVLFELPEEDLPTFVTEMLRLGNDRQSYRGFTNPTCPEEPRVLLRVIGPPYYTLLRALDRGTGQDGTVRAYVEQAPRVWVEVGFTHPLAKTLRLPDTEAVLLRAPREWVFLDDTPFQDVYDLLQFELPAEWHEWGAAAEPEPIEVPLRLAAGNAADVPEFWVLTRNALGQLDTLVRDAPASLLARLSFAIGTDAAGATLAVLRTRPSKLPSPVLPLENALGYKPYFKLTNLFVPAGQRLHPTLRRDAVRRLLADDPDDVVWLQPGEPPATFTPMSLPDGAFRSLVDWVEYVIEAEQEPLAAWIESARFDFESFVCKETSPRPPRESAPEQDASPLTPARADGSETPATPETPDAPEAPLAEPPPLAPLPVERTRNAWLEKRKQLEEAFTQIEGPLDAPERLALWPQLAAASAGAGDATEAAICWLNALWSVPGEWPVEFLDGWRQVELPNEAAPTTAREFDRRLVLTTPTLGESRALVATFLSLAHGTPPDWLPARLPALQHYLEQHERSLPVRAVWLAALRLAQLSGADVLGLARVRDRLLQRLLEEGLSPERDMPGFLRYAGLRDSERLRAIRDKALDLHATVRKWFTDYKPMPPGATLAGSVPFVDLFFAFALAKLGEATPARKLLEAAHQVLAVPAAAQDLKATKLAQVRQALFEAFRYRIEQALAGQPHSGPLGPQVQTLLQQVAARAAGTDGQKPVFSEVEYVIEKMRQESFILEPYEKLDPYRVMTRTSDPLHRELAALPEVRDPARLADRVRKLFREGFPGKPLAAVRFALLRGTLMLSPRVGEAFALELLQHVPGILADSSPTLVEGSDLVKQKGELFERALFLAAHYDRTEMVRELIERFVAYLHALPREADRFVLMNVVAGQSLQSLRKLGLRDVMDRLLGQFHADVLRGRSLAEMRKAYAVRSEFGATWGLVLEALLNIANAWLTFGLTDQAAPILDEARSQLTGAGKGKLEGREVLQVSRAYVEALGQAPSETGLTGLRELFETMPAGKLMNVWTGSWAYSRSHLLLAESVVLALVSETSALGPTGRRWLDDDEYLVRRRIHRDMQRHLDHAGA